MATQAARDTNRLRVLLDIEALLEALAMKLPSAMLFDGAASRSLYTGLPETKLAELYERQQWHERLVFGSLAGQLPAEATLAEIRAFVQSLIANLANGADPAVIQLQLTAALARIDVLENA